MFPKYVSNPRAKSLGNWDVWEKRLKKIRPVYWFFSHIVMRKISYWGYALDRYKWWWIHRLVPRHRYHVMHSRLKPEYYCFDTVLLHAAFERFCDEYPHTKEIVMLEPKVEKELDRLMKWWREGRPAQEKEMEDTLSAWHDAYTAKKYSPLERKLFKKHMKLETKLDKDDLENLLSLVRLKDHVSW